MTQLARRDSDRGNREADPGDEWAAARAETWTGGPQLITRVATAGLWLMLAAGPVALALVVATSLVTPQPPPSAPAADVPDDDARTAVEEFAQRLVVDWLQTTRGDEERLEAYGLLDLETRQPEIGQHASYPAATRATEVGPGLWSVTVGVTVTDAEPAVTAAEPEEPPESADDPAPGDQVESEQPAPLVPLRQYFQVSVEYRDGLLAAQTLPAAVPAPPTARHSRLIYDEVVDTRDPLGEAAAGFLSALLTGSGDVGRYTAENSAITAVASRPYRQVELTGIRADDAPDPGVQPVDGDRIRVLVTAVARTHAQQEITVQYPLTLIARPGRWEVVEITPAAHRAGTDS